MISLITLALELINSVINIFVKNADRNTQLKDQMFRLIEQHTKSVMRDGEARKDLEAMRAEIKRRREEKEKEKKA